MTPEGNTKTSSAGGRHRPEGKPPGSISDNKDEFEGISAAEFRPALWMKRRIRPAGGTSKAAQVSARTGAVTITKVVPTTAPATPDGQDNQPGRPLIKPWPIAAKRDRCQAAVVSQRIQKCRQVSFLLVR